jgi:hypothetical protein
VCSVIGGGGSCWGIRSMNCVFGDWGRGSCWGIRFMKQMVVFMINPSLLNRQICKLFIKECFLFISTSYATLFNRQFVKE